MDTRELDKKSSPYGEEPHRRPGIGAWMARNSSLLVRLATVLILSLAASLVASNFSYGLEGKPERLPVEEINSGQLPPGVEVGDYVKITGSPNFSTNPETGEPSIGLSSRYEVSYYYFRLNETGDNLLIQTSQQPPDVNDTGEQVYKGRLATVGTVLFHDTTQRGLEIAGLPRDESIPVVETGDTPQYYREIFPAYGAILGVWILSILWLAWKRNKPFLDE
jgi:hypothetical protein